MPNKHDRQRAIRELIEARAIGSQEELRRLLLGRGWDVTQSTLSRDLREMRLARVPTADGVRYAFTGASVAEDRPRLAEMLPRFFQQVDGVGELCVLHTASGGAQPVSEAIDLEAWPEVMGTIAGENTILIICRSSAGRDKVQRRLRALGHGEE
jgi:transcriptional regulator of arginine metabolism